MVPRPRRQRDLGAAVAQFLPQINSRNDGLYGARVHVRAWDREPTGAETPLGESTYYVYRYVDVADASVSAINSSGATAAAPMTTTRPPTRHTSTRH